MAAVQICRFYKYGYCRFQDMCRYQHVHELCEDLGCEIRLCQKRHPKTCIYFQELKRCKFGDSCQYNHASRNVMVASQHQDELEALLSEVKALQESIRKLEKVNEGLKSRLETVELRLESSPVVRNESRGLTANEDDDPPDGHVMEHSEEIWISRREALGPAYASFPSWSFKTP